jgi:hypothetical protein
VVSIYDSEGAVSKATKAKMRGHSVVPERGSFAFQDRRWKIKHGGYVRAAGRNIIRSLG